MHVCGRRHVGQLSALTKPGVYADGGGLYLRVRPSGTRSWVSICVINGKRREIQGLRLWNELTRVCRLWLVVSSLKPWPEMA